MSIRIRYPNSFLKLLLVGFAFAILPLIIAFINANIAFDAFSKKSQATITNSVKATRASLVLQEQLHLMERSARQYFVLSDEELFLNYLASRTEFVASVQTLLEVTHNPKEQAALKQLSKNENDIYRNILSVKERGVPELEFLNAFDQLSILIEAIIKQNNTSIDEASYLLEVESANAQGKFFLQSLILIPFTLLVAGAIAYMLGRPIQRMDTAIKDLGKGEYTQEITIDGPGDLRILGQRLDWLRKELLNLKEQKQLFLQHISHELKTPLTAIREATELLSDGIGGKLSQQQYEIAQILKDNSIRLQKMIENLLNFTKMESNNHLLKIESINVNETISSVLQSHELSIRNKQLSINTQYKIDSIKVDKLKFITIIDNLISNAVKFTPQKGSISISVKQEKQWQIIEVIDSGSGLAKEDSDRLFDPFYQGKTLHQGLVNSSGLGLSITKDLTEMHQGDINLKDSEKGAHFVVRLPILDQ